MPTYPPSWSVGLPVWMPIRTRTCSPPGQGYDASSRWACAAAATASGADAKTTKKLSPSVPISAPSDAAHAARRTPRMPSRTSAYAEPRRISRVVEPSMSENSIVTVPVGKECISQLQSSRGSVRQPGREVVDGAA